MPDIPDHLKDRPTDRVGRPIPYVNVIGKWEVAERWTIRFDRQLREVAAFYEDDPDGDPDFTHQSIQRSRECIHDGLCQVCARFIDWPDRKLVISAVSVKTINLTLDEHRGTKQRVPVVFEPWLCPDCASFASRICPELIRRQRDDDFHIVAVRSPDVCRLTLSHGWIEGPFEEATKANPVAMWANIMLPGGMITNPVVGKRSKLWVPGR